MKHSLFSTLRRFGVSAFIVMAALVGLSGEAQALSCPSGKVQQGGLCFKPALPGYSCNGPVCQEDCRSGYSPSLPGFCHYRGSPTYTEKPFGKKHASKPHKCGLFWYANCRAGYRMDLCGTCGYKAAWDTTRAVYTREGTLPPDYSAALNQVGSNMQATYGSSLGAIQNGYYAAADVVQDGIDALTVRLFKAAAKAALANGGGAALAKIATNFKALADSPDDLNDLRRVLDIVARKSVLAGDDLKDVAKVVLRMGAKAGSSCDASINRYIGIPSFFDYLPSKMQNSHYGVYASASGVAVGGVTTTIAIVANCFKDADEKIQIRVLSSTGGVIGGTVEAAVAMGFLWAPGSVTAETGPYIGIGSGVEVGVGVDGGLSWSISKGMRGAQNAIPGYNVGMGAGIGADPLHLTAGHTLVLGSYSVDLSGL